MKDSLHIHIRLFLIGSLNIYVIQLKKPTTHISVAIYKLKYFSYGHLVMSRRCVYKTVYCNALRMFPNCEGSYFMSLFIKVALTCCPTHCQEFVYPVYDNLKLETCLPSKHFFVPEMFPKRNA